MTDEKTTASDSKINLQHLINELDKLSGSIMDILGLEANPKGKSTETEIDFLLVVSDTIGERLQAILQELRKLHGKE